MSTELRDRLAAVAGRAPAVSPPEDLWRRGRRRHLRRSVAGATVAAVMAVAVGVVGGQVWSWTERQMTDPVDTPGPELVLPDHVFTPSPWLEGTDDAGPIGPLVALIGGPRRHRTNLWAYERVDGIAGISASGDYRYLDLPGWVGFRSPWETKVVLSPDGRYVAYWAVGATADEPVPGEGDTVARAAAVYDTVTGRTDRREIGSTHGLAPQGIAWAGEAVRMSYRERRGPGTQGETPAPRPAGYASWDARDASWSVIEEPEELLSRYAAQGAGHVVGYSNQDPLDHELVGPDGVERTFRIPLSLSVGPVPSPDGRRVAGLGAGPDQGTPARPILVADLDRLDGRGRVVTRQVPGFEAYVVHGWRDDSHVIAEQWNGAGLYSVDVRTGEATLLMTPVDLDVGQGLQVAHEAWQAPVVSAEEPRWPWDPRLRVALVAGAVLLGWVTVRAWRRRRGA